VFLSKIIKRYSFVKKLYLYIFKNFCYYLTHKDIKGGAYILGAGKIYLQPMEMVYNAMLDLMELQNGNEIESDPLDGKLCFTVMLYGFTLEIKFTALSAYNNRCGVYLEIREITEITKTTESGGGESQNNWESLIEREYSLLDAMLLFGAPPEITHTHKERNGTI